VLEAGILFIVRRTARAQFGAGRLVAVAHPVRRRFQRSVDRFKPRENFAATVRPAR
jgi:hypothetical protein